MTLIATYLRNYGLWKTWLDNIIKIPVSEERLTSNMVNVPKHCRNLNDGTFTRFIDKWRNLNWKRSVLVIWKILRLFVNTLTAADKYSLLNRGILTEPIHMQLSWKQKKIFWNFFCLFEAKLKFEHFEIEDDHDCWCILEIMDSEKRG